MKKLFLVLILLFFVVNSFQYAQNSRPKVGLVLSGGGAKGLAHIGILKELEKAGIRPDYITGTSMGAVIGGLYASGYSAKELEKLVTTVDWDYLLTDKINRSILSIDEKNNDGKYFLSLPVENFSIKLPKGLISGQNLSILLRELCLPVNNIADFNNLPIPFACFAIDIVTGEKVKLDRGYLPDAIRASMSIPSVFTPIRLNNKLLIDGGITQNFPVKDIIEMGADIVIGVDVGTQMVKEEKLSTLFSIMDQTMTLQSNENNLNQQKLCDILIVPDVTNYGTASFSSADSLIKIGNESAKTRFNDFVALKTKLDKFGKQEELNIPAAAGGFQIYKIKIIGHKNVSSQMILNKLNIKENRFYTIKELEDAVLRLYGSLYFDRVDYSLEKFNLGMDLTIRVIEKNPSLVRFGIHYDQNSLASLRFNYTQRNLLSKGSKLSLDAILGSDPEISATYFFQPRWKEDIGIELETNFSNFDTDIYTETIGEEKEEEMGQASLDISFVKGSLRANLSRSFLIGAGIKFEYHYLNYYVFQDRAIGEKQYTLKYDYKEDYGILNYFGYLKFDTFDRTIYPTEGVKFNSLLEIVPGLERDLTFTNEDGIHIIEDQKLRDFWRLQVDYQHLFKISNRFTAGFSIRGGINSTNDIPFMYQFLLGGITKDRGSFIPFSGSRLAEYQTFNFLMSRLHLQYRLFDKTYLVYYGDIARPVEKYQQLFDKGDILKGYTLTIGYDSFIGPIELSMMGKNNSPHTHTQISVGLNL